MYGPDASQVSLLDIPNVLAVLLQRNKVLRTTMIEPVLSCLVRIFWCVNILGWQRDSHANKETLR